MSLLPTLLNEYQAPYAPNLLDKYNDLSAMLPKGFWGAFLADTPNTLGGISSEIDRFGQPQIKGVDIPVIGRNAETVSADHPDCNIVATQSTSAFETPVYSPVTYNFKTPTSAELNQLNVVTAQNIINKELNQAFGMMGIELDLRGFTAMNAARTQVYANPVDMTFALTPDFQLEVASGEARDYAINNLVASLVHNGFGDSYQMVGEAAVNALISRISNQGSGNAENLAYQLGLANFNRYSSTNVTNAVGDYGTAYIAAAGSLAGLTALHRNSVNAMSLTENDEWGVISNTPLGVPVGYHRQRTCVSGATGAEYYDSWTLTVYAAFMTAWVENPATDQHPITKMVLKV